ncbi:hypothetical protein [Nocardia terpenica]|uniref:Uncharacterized protein n=1 Tax=Nocardia terpenica TaxID=455432 RepID=A0A164KPL5_9NOCA|nr:hypothetical protein [Nocardia terpenica]KZM71601.1 hypothetical protein AWN90_02415 [Nocardia terpenica]NQE90813.1 hypothetical protein [Nocardia terpenica]
MSIRPEGGSLRHPGVGPRTCHRDPSIIGYDLEGQRAPHPYFEVRGSLGIPAIPIPARFWPESTVREVDSGQKHAGITGVVGVKRRASWTTV